MTARDAKLVIATKTPAQVAGLREQEQLLPLSRVSPPEPLWPAKLTAEAPEVSHHNQEARPYTQNNYHITKRGSWHV
jgi:hypothetical protein